MGKIAAVYYTISLLLVIDMGLDFITAYYKHGNLITDNKQIALHYFYGNFMFDLIAVNINNYESSYFRLRGYLYLSLITDLYF